MSLLPAFLSDSLDDVVFEGRNQAYGAYQLRQDYQQNLASAGGITVALCGLLLLGWATWKHFRPTTVALTHTTGIIDLIKPPIVPTIEKPKLAVLSPPRARAAATHPAPVTPTQVAKDDAPQPHLTTPPPITAIPDGPTGPVTPGATTPDPAALPGDTGGGPSGPAEATAPPAINEPVVFVEKMPEFAGGQAALLRYLQSHLRYPGSALAAGVGGRVFMSFVVGTDGRISDVTILKGLGYGLDEEAQRVVRQMPAWTPGYQAKRAVAVRFTLPITFSIQ